MITSELYNYVTESKTEYTKCLNDIFINLQVRKCLFHFILFYFFSVPRFIVYVPHPELHAICALLNTHHQALPTTPAPPKPSVCFPESTVSHGLFPPLTSPIHFSFPSPNVLHVIPYAPQVSETT